VVVAAGHTLRLGLDTGTSRTLVSAAAAGRLGLTSGERLAVGCVASVQPRGGFCAKVPALHIGQLTLAPDCIGWLPDEARLAGAEDLDGLLGADLLAQVDLWIDAAKNPVRVRVAPAGSLGAWVEGTRLPIEMIKRRPAITVALAGLRREGPSVRLVVDSGGDGLILFGRAAQLANALFPHERIAGRVETATAARGLDVIPVQGVRTGGSLFSLPYAGLLPQVEDRVEDGLLPLTALGPVLLDLSNRIIVAKARIRSATQ
jgi:hypothetical protein